MSQIPDISCVPFAKKKIYYLLTIPFLVLLVATFIYLWTIHVGLAPILFSFYVLACVFQAYCCAYQDCPYIGGWCPGVAGIIPASRIARMLYGKSIKKTPMRFALFGTIAFCSLVGSGVFPFYWLAQRATWLAVAGFNRHSMKSDS
jgi:hypothetical protein